MKLNVIIPCFNEEGNVGLLHQKLVETLGETDYELIFVNDGSTDKTALALEKVYQSDKEHVKVINFSRNFGKDAAMYAGLTHAKAEYSVIIDSDLQQNPKHLIKMMTYLDEHPEVDQVAMVNKEKINPLVKFLKWSFYLLMNIISDTKFKSNSSDFRMFRASVVEAICSLSENNRFSKGIFSWVGFNTFYMTYTVENRNSGKSNFRLVNQFKYAFNGIVNFSVKPLRIATVTGFFFAIIAFVYLIVTVIETISTGSSIPGYPTIICLILLLGGIQLIAIGVLGEYVAKSYLEAKKRPVYVAKSKLGFNEENIL